MVRPLASARAGFAWLAVAFWMGLIFFLSSRADVTTQGEGGLYVGVYKLAHLAVFAVLGALVAHALRMPAVERYGWAILIVVTYAVSDELHQAFVPGRSPSVSDVGIDTIGGFIGMRVVIAGWIDRVLAIAFARNRRRMRADPDE